METTDILIIGSSISAQLAASYLRQRLPELSVAVAGPEAERRPIVGESTISITARFMVELGLGDVLVEKHYPKYALTYYYKERLDDPRDRTYHVSESPFVLPELSYNLNRFTFDQQVRAYATRLGAQQIAGRVRDLEVHGAEPKRVMITDATGQERTIAARFLVDASGRSRVVGRKLKLDVPYPTSIAQRSSYWFRLRGFDRRILAKIHAIKKENRAYDSYYVTHHFMGRGNWIWCIPMRADDGVDFISVGICYRGDLYSKPISDVASFLAAVREEHPVVAEFTESGEVTDEQQYRNYMYDTRQQYSIDNWFLIGDAARAVDPLYSTGIASTTIHIQQVAELIRLANEGRSSPRIVQDFDALMRAMQYGSQADISALYEVMHDRFQCQSRMHLSSLTFFHLFAPHVATGQHFSAEDCQAFARQLGSESRLTREYLELFPLLERAARAGHLSAEDYPEVQSAAVFNTEFYAHLRKSEIPRSLRTLWQRFGAFKDHLEGILDSARSRLNVADHEPELERALAVRRDQ